MVPVGPIAGCLLSKGPSCCLPLVACTFSWTRLQVWVAAAMGCVWGDLPCRLPLCPPCVWGPVLHSQPRQAPPCAKHKGAGRTWTVATHLHGNAAVSAQRQAPLHAEHKGAWQSLSLPLSPFVCVCVCVCAFGKGRGLAATPTMRSAQCFFHTIPL